jgi:hypothetical protein
VSGADLNGAHLDYTDLTVANLSGANLSGARNLTQAQLDRACGVQVTLPDRTVHDLEPCPPQPFAPALNRGATP